MKDAIFARLLLDELYQKFYGICDHNRDASGYTTLELVAYHPAEEAYELSAVVKLAEEFKNLNMAKTLNISFFDYVKLTDTQANQLKAVCRAQAITENKEISNILSGANVRV